MRKLLFLLLLSIVLWSCSTQKLFYIKPKSIKTYKELTKEYYKAFEVLENNNLIKDKME